MQGDAPLGDHPFDIAARCDSSAGQQFGDALRTFFTGRAGLGTALWLLTSCVAPPLTRHRCTLRSLRGHSFLSYGVRMLFGKRKRIVNRILIVEDEPLTAFDNENLIGDLGYEVVATLDRFADAVATLDSEQVDLILCDVRLTGERTGIDLAQVAMNRRIPVLFVTGAPPENASELVIGCLLKPYSDRTLKATLAAVDKYLGGEKVRPPRGLTLYPSAKV
jgi:CheY-like chemotaxis protein